MYYHFLVHLFAYEFVYDRLPSSAGNDEQFDQYLSYWIKKGYLLPMNDLTYRINSTHLQAISLITSPFEQYARAYLLIYEQENLSAEKNSSLLIKAYQKALLSKTDSHSVVSVIASSSNVISNALRTLNGSSKSAMLADLRHLLRKLFPTTAAHLRAKL